MSNEKEKKKIDKIRLNRLIDMVSQTRRIEWIEHCPIYPNGLYENLCMLVDLDMNYMENYKKLGDPINYSKLSFEEVQTVLTYLVRGERFCDGLIGSFISSGELLLLLRRLKELVSEQPASE